MTDTRVCACPCERPFVARHPRQVLADPSPGSPCKRWQTRQYDLRKKHTRQREAARKRGASCVAEVEGVLPDVLFAMNTGKPPVPTLPGLASVVRNIASADRAGDTTHMKWAVEQLAAWALARLVRLAAAPSSRAHNPNP